MTSTITLASISTIRKEIFKLLHNKRPSLSPHSSVAKLLVAPTCLVNPATQLPCSSLTTPPHPNCSIHPITEPSMFNFFHPKGGFSHLILLLVLRTRLRGDETQNINSAAWLEISLYRFGFGLFLLKTKNFCSSKCTTHQS